MLVLCRENTDDLMLSKSQSNLIIVYLDIITTIKKRINLKIFTSTISPNIAKKADNDDKRFKFRKYVFMLSKTTLVI